MAKPLRKTLPGSSLYRFKSGAADPLFKDTIRGELKGGPSTFVEGVIPKEGSGNYLVYTTLQRLFMSSQVYTITEKRSSPGVNQDISLDYTIEFRYLNTSIGGTLTFTYSYNSYAYIVSRREITFKSFTPVDMNFKSEVLGGGTNGNSSYLWLTFFYPESKVRTDLVVNVSLRGSFDVLYVTEFSGSTNINTASARLMSINIPIIRIKATTDIYYGSELAQCVFVGDRTYSQYLREFGEYVVGKGTLARKCLGKGDILSPLCYYGLLRYFLYQQITSIFTLEILRRRYTRVFTLLVEKSVYKPYLTLLDQSMEAYFIW